MPKICSGCGNLVDDGCAVCSSCGAPAEQTGVQQPPPVQQPIYQPVQEEKTPSVGMWVGFLLLASIPTVGLIILIVTACGGITKSAAMKKWAQAMLIFKLIGIVLEVILVIFLFAVGTEFLPALLGLS